MQKVGATSPFTLPIRSGSVTCNKRRRAGNVLSTPKTTPESAAEQRFREAALPHLDAVYTLARYLLREPADAEDAVQECYLRAMRHFDTFRGEDIKPWLLAILRNVCHVEFRRRSRILLYDANAEADDLEGATPIWQNTQKSPESELEQKSDARTMQELVAALPEAFREVILLREVEDLSYRQISEILDVPIGTVMSRLARARETLREAWLKTLPEE
jgi:RNA polymerase sigma-70 factor, ECF subfamily